MDLSAIRAVANAVLYEGYMLYPYRPSALKNRSQGWTFGTLLPAQYAAAHPGEADRFHAEMLITGSDPEVTAELRFLQLRGPEAVERTVSVACGRIAQLPASGIEVQFGFPQSGCDDKELYPVNGYVQVRAGRSGSATKIIVSTVNRSMPAREWSTRDAALRQALVSAHAVLTIRGGEFISLLSPPEEFAEAAAACKQGGVFPVLVGSETERSAMLVSPIILYDYPQIAAKSHGDLFDSTEIDEILTLRVLTLTDAEKEEVRKANRRARALLERTEALTADDLLNLHGEVEKR